MNFVSPLGKHNSLGHVVGKRVSQATRKKGENEREREKQIFPLGKLWETGGEKEMKGNTVCNFVVVGFEILKEN